MLVLIYNLKLFLLIHTHNTQDLSMLCVFKELPVVKILLYFIIFLLHFQPGVLRWMEDANFRVCTHIWIIPDTKVNGSSSQAFVGALDNLSQSVWSYYGSMMIWSLFDQQLTYNVYTENIWKFMSATQKIAFSCFKLHHFEERQIIPLKCNQMKSE